MSSARELKRALRRELRSRVQAVPAALWISEGARIVARLTARREWREARRLLLYAPMAGEPDVWPLAVQVLAEGRALALPRYNAAADAYEAAEVRDLDREIVPGSFGIREPACGCPVRALNELDFVLVPGLGFDLAGRRLGHGKGYYDRLLALISGTACGVAMDWQVLGAIPVESHDAEVNCIVTPSRWLAVERRGFDS